MPGGVVAVGGYLPILRMSRKLLSKELAWSGLGASRAGFRTVAGWDEDALTMAVEAARSLVEVPPTAIRFASTSAYFTNRAQAGLIVDALALPRSVRTVDLANSYRAGVTALLDALLNGADEVVTAAEKRPTQAGSAAQALYGEGGAAVRTGVSGGAKLIGHASLTHDLVAQYASVAHPTAYAYEERFVRDVSITEILLPVVQEALQNAGATSGAFTHVACAEPVAGCWRSVASKLELTSATNHCETLLEQVGDLGAAHAIFGFALALAAAKPGDHILLVGCGGGADALVFELTSPVEGARETANLLREGQAMESVTRFLNLVSAIDLDWGMRAEFEQKAQATVLERVGRDAIGFIGGRDSTGNVQFPKSAYPVNPALQAPERLEDVRLADMTAKIISVTADRLNYTPDPPFDFGLVQFENGARVLMELVDRPVQGFEVGNLVRMRLRIKSENERLGFRTYFWKAAPSVRTDLGDS